MSTVKQFYSDFHKKSAPLLGWSLSNQLWSLRETLFEDFKESHFAILKELDAFLCKEKNRQVSPPHEMGGGSARSVESPFSWKVKISESYEVLDLNEWIADSIELGQLKPEQETGYSELDLNFETQQVCGVQLEEFHRGTWAMKKIRRLFAEESFEPMETVDLDGKTHLVNVFSKVDKLLNTQVHGGLNHPYKISAGVATLILVDHRGEEPKEYPVLRHFVHTHIPAVIERLKDDVKEHYQGLMKTIQEQQLQLNTLPDGWPNDVVYGMAQQWAKRRFLGDSGLVGSDFFDGIWLNSLGPLEVVGSASNAAVQDLAVDATENLSFAQLRLRRQMARRKETSLGKEASEEASTLETSPPRKDPFRL